MCGLTGIFSPNSGDHLNEVVSKMTSCLIHRGPDDGGIWGEKNICIGHRRLSIIDLSEAGKQPMTSHCDRYIIAINGEIYNHLELREQLERKEANFQWKGHSDTETLLAAISYWGIDEALRLSQGMFALALWDKFKKKLVLARDRIGEKPLYWGWAGKHFIFGSELKALRAHPDCSNEINKESLIQYFRYSYIPAPYSIYKNIFKLEPGTILSVKESPPLIPPNKPIPSGERYETISINRYWDLKDEIEYGHSHKIFDEREATLKLENSLRSSVQKQMLSDVPLGAFLSGGVDSSTIVAMMQSQSNKPVNTFTIGFDEKTHDESSHADSVASYLGTEHNMLKVTDSDARDVIPKLPWLYDEPFADSSQIPTYLVCHAARQHVTVALSGDGGDELFGGYNRYIHGPGLYRKISILPEPLKKIFSLATLMLSEQGWNYCGSIYNKLRAKKEGISNLGMKIHKISEQIYHTKSFTDFHRNLLSTWLEPKKLLTEDINESFSLFNNKLKDLSINDHSNQMMFQDILTYLPDDILCKVDRAAMGVNLETRAPFLDPSLISLSTRIPMNMKIRKGHGKWLLRQVLYKYVPSKIIDRPKIGFSVPIGQWLRGPLREWAQELLSEEKLAESGLFNPKIFHKTWAQHLSGRIDRSSKLWPILMFQAWHASIK